MLDPHGRQRYGPASMWEWFQYTHRLVLCLFLSAGVSACDNGIRILNVAPTVTAVGPIEYADGTAKITVWLYDYETDATDLSVSLLRKSLATELVDFDGDGIRGLTTSRDTYGRPHDIIWTPNPDVSATDDIQLQFIPSDGDIGPVFTTPPFSLAAGLPAP